MSGVVPSSRSSCVFVYLVGYAVVLSLYTQRQVVMDWVFLYGVLRAGNDILYIPRRELLFLSREDNRSFHTNTHHDTTAVSNILYI